MTFNAIVCPSRQAWLDLRRNYLTGTDIAQVLGFHPTKGPADVWADKMGLRGDEDSEPAAWGRFFQDGILRKWALETGNEVIMAPENSIWPHASIPWLATSGDGSVAARRAVVEAKSNASFWEDGIPPMDNRIQVQAQIFCTGADEGVIVGFVNRFRPTIHHTMELDQAFWDSALPVLEKFWWHVQKKTLPGDPSWYTKSAVSLIWPEARVGSVIKLEESDALLANRIDRLNEFSKWAEKELDAAKVALAVRLGDHETGDLPDGSSYTLKTVSVKASFCDCGKETRKASQYRKAYRKWPPHLAEARKQLKNRRLLK